MALVNHRAREIHFKIVYYGPGLGGKTTNLKVLHDRLPADKRGRLMSIATEHERTLFFDFMAVNLGLVQGFSTRFHLYTVPGQVYYRLSRRAVLQGLDAVVFVADSAPGREAANRDSLADLETHLDSLGLGKLLDLPRVFQYNKRDVPGALPLDRLRAALNPSGAAEFEAVASEGRGVAETLRAACKVVLVRLSTPDAVATVAANGANGSATEPHLTPMATVIAPVPVVAPVSMTVASAPFAPAFTPPAAPAFTPPSTPAFTPPSTPAFTPPSTPAFTPPFAPASAPAVPASAIPPAPAAPAPVVPALATSPPPPAAATPAATPPGRTYQRRRRRTTRWAGR